MNIAVLGGGNGSYAAAADFTLAGHDWWHYAEKLRKEKFAFDENQIKPYFQLNNVL